MTVNPLKSSLRTITTTNDLERVVVNALWGTSWSPREYANHQAAYSTYYSGIYQPLCRAACSGDWRIPDYTHEDVISIINSLKLTNDKKNDVLKDIPHAVNLSPSQSERAVNLAAGLLVPLNFDGIGGARPGKRISWEPEKTLKQTIDEEFQVLSNQAVPANPVCATCTSTIKFPRKFGLWDLKFIAGFNIVWTNSLLDHLSVVDEENQITVYIFHQVSILELHQTVTPDVIPADLIEETFETLALLLPRTDEKTTAWYDKLQKKHDLDPGTFRRSYLKLEDRELHHFKYWRSRLVKLKKAFDEHEPNKPTQWWRDDRKPVQWWTFWVAILVLILTILFGLIQSVTGLLQVILS
ncbi:hypothetical protein BP6252_10872 [Coleophoma cylindrospora]|uniref:Uncharacterized protein n=1 Tax=Coleophoma cylindrospora TaxID=1849047 RepID=A0A3D8QNF7_9HELO|nr:hypothetical protein BP6252_10872 [Coleophoma cylindrospora]